MSGTKRNPRAELEAAQSLPYGLARTAAVEAVVDLADTSGDDVLARDARLELISAYAYGGEPMKEFTPFSWLLNRYDRDPGLFDRTARWQLLWRFKWVTAGALKHPAVTLKDLHGSLNDMQERYRAAGEGLAPYLGSRFQVDAHVDGHAQAETSYRAWTEAERTGLSDCEACEPTNRVIHLAATARPAEAARESIPVLNGTNTCAEQPQAMIAAVLESLLIADDPVRAATEHLRGVRLSRGKPGSTSEWAGHIQVLARSGRLLRGLDLLEDHLHEVDDPPTPLDGMWLAAAGARLLRGLADQGHNDLLVTTKAGRAQLKPEPEGLPEAQQRLTRTARDLAAQFDARNGTTTIGTAVEGWLDASELPDLPLGEVSSRRGRERPPPSPATDPALSPATDPALSLALSPASRPVIDPGLTTPEPVSPAPADLTLGDLAALYTLSQRTGSAQQRRRLLDNWRSQRDRLLPGPEAAPEDQVTAAKLDAMVIFAETQAGDPRPRRAATARLREVGQYEYAIGCDLDDLIARAETEGNFPECVAELDRLLAEAGKHCTQAERGALALTTIGVLQRGDPEDEALQARVSQSFDEGIRNLQQDDVAALNPYHRSCLTILLAHRAPREPIADRITALRAALDVLPPGWRAGQRAAIGHWLAAALAESGDFPAARNLLEEVTREAQIAGIATLTADAFEMLGRIHEHTGDAPAAVVAFSSAVEWLQKLDRPIALASGQQDLVHALRAAGRTLEAAELAETALQTLQSSSRDHARWHGSERANVHDHELEGGDELKRQAGTLAYAAALAASELGELAHAATLARRSAAWHHSIGWPAAEAEALALAARTEPDPAQAVPLFHEAARLFDLSERWHEAARCRRLVAAAVFESDGIAAARACLAAARSALDELTGAITAVPEYALEQALLTEDTARILATDGSLDEALSVLAGVDEVYRELGYARAARNAIGLRADLLNDLERGGEGLDQLSKAAEEALAAGSTQEARQLGGQLARLLDGLGRPEEAEVTWQRFA